MNKDTQLSRTARGPSVEFIPAYDGTIDAILDCYREKVGGGLENITIRFPDLDLAQVACIGSAARKAVWRAKGRFEETAQAAYDRIITPGQ